MTRLKFKKIISIQLLDNLLIRLFPFLRGIRLRAFKIFNINVENTQEFLENLNLKINSSNENINIGRSKLAHYEKGFAEALNAIGVETLLILISENSKYKFFQRIEDKYPSLLIFDRDIESKIFSAIKNFNPEYILFLWPTLIKEKLIKKSYQNEYKNTYNK